MPRNQQSRRTFLGSVFSTTAAVLGTTCKVSRPLPASAPQDEWGKVPEILSRIESPVFRDQDYRIEDYGAVGNGKIDCTDGFREAITECHRSGGGRVLVTPGVYLSGPIHLKSQVNLHIESGATIKFSTDPAAYLPPVYSRWEGTELLNYSPLIYAFEQENIGITGNGTLDGQADENNWWRWKGRTEYGWKENDPHQGPATDRLREMAARAVPVEERAFGEGHFLRPQFIQPYRCQRVLIQGLTIKNSPMWEVHPVLCRNVTVQGIRVTSHGPNNDGCNPESCSDVLIKDCYFDTGDDCIALKSGRNEDGRRVGQPCENVIIQGCTMRDGHGGVVLGSEVSGNIRNVYAENCQMDSPNLERVLRIKTNSVRGGIVENVFIRNIEVGQVADAVVRVNFFYQEGDVGPYNPVVRNIEVRNVNSRKSSYGIYLRGYADSPITDIRLIDCTFQNVENPNLIENVRNLSLVNTRINGQLFNEEIDVA
jgi:polygalacturonase